MSGIKKMIVRGRKETPFRQYVIDSKCDVEKMKEELAPLFNFKKLAEFKSILCGILQTPHCIENLLELVCSVRYYSSVLYFVTAQAHFFIIMTKTMMGVTAMSYLPVLYSSSMSPANKNISYFLI